ncbi:hypothetical protein [Rhizobium leguminosarum]|uniref:hypothetical protein n=1 Tax=Rhizobium leguminosarum TaxID=384 RepID=UPI001031576D|nr:hypothetical protein [Rhizobium leguminosarum]TBG52559.1 hypothetical protein ELG74_36290 [Rhizobium leguminosarum]
MTLPLLDPFSAPVEVREAGLPTLQEIAANEQRHRIGADPISISDALDAANYVGRYEDHNWLNNHITDALKKTSEYQAWHRAMPSRTPKAIAAYQKNYAKSDLATVDSEINLHGSPLPVGQQLFHGGLWSSMSGAITSRPLSTSLSPTVAFSNALYRAKAYDAGRLDLIVLRTTVSTNAFVFKSKGTKLAHELEVLLPAGISLKVLSETCARTDYRAAKAIDDPVKTIPVYVVEAEIA